MSPQPLKEFTATQVAVLQEETLSQLRSIAEMVAKNTEDITLLREQGAENTRNIAQNTRDITRNTRDITQNTRDITENTQNIALNTRDIAQNTRDIATIRRIVESKADAVALEQLRRTVVHRR